MNTKVTITTKIDPDNADRLDGLAEAIGMTRSELVAHCIALGLRRGEEIASALSPPTSANYLRLDFNRDEGDQQAIDELNYLWIKDELGQDAE